MNNAKNHRTTGRVLAILELVCTNATGFTLSEICSALDAPKSSLFPLLHTMENRGFLMYDKVSGRYRIGSSAFRVGSRYLNDCNVMNEIQSVMEGIVDICKETCHFGTLKNGDVFYIKKVDSPEPIRMMSSIGLTLPAYATGLGKALLVDYRLEDLKKLYYTGLAPLTENTITSFHALAQQLKTAQAEGFTYEAEESNKYIRCIAVPIRKNGKVVASYSVAVPVFRYSDALGQTIRGALLRAKQETEHLIAYTNIQF